MSRLASQWCFVPICVFAHTKYDLSQHARIMQACMHPMMSPYILFLEWIGLQTCQIGFPPVRLFLAWLNKGLGQNPLPTKPATCDGMFGHYISGMQGASSRVATQRISSEPHLTDSMLLREASWGPSQKLHAAQWHHRNGEANYDHQYL